MTRFVGDGLADQARRRPDDEALVVGGRRWTWGALFGQVRHLSSVLAKGHLIETRIGIALADPGDALVAFLAVARRGGVAMVLDVGWPPARMARILEAAAPDTVIDPQRFAALLSEREFGEQAEAPFPDTRDLFYIGFTSGSTGDPKGYARSHGSWLESFAISTAQFGIGPGDTVFIPGSFAHSLHLYGAVHGLCVGARVVVQPSFRPRELASQIRGVDAAVLYATPTQIHYLQQELDKDGPATTVRLVLASGAKWTSQNRRALARSLPEARLVEFYGASEMSFVSLALPEDNVPDGSVGRPAPGVSVAVFGDDGQPVATGTPGALFVKSRMLFSGYVCGGGDEIRWQGDWLTVGDRGYFDRDGHLYLLGRDKRMIVTSGQNIYPEEVESCLLSHPEIRHAVVFGAPDPVRGQRLVAALNLASPASLDELRRHCRDFLGAARTPQIFHILAAWQPGR